MIARISSVAGLWLLAASAASASPFSAGNLVVYRVGDGSGSLLNTGNPVFLDEYTPTGALVQSIVLPTAAAGANKPLIASGTASSEGLLSRSGDGHYLLLSGYARAPGGSGSLASTTGAAVNRVVGRVDVSGAVDTSTTLADFADGNNPRSVASSNGNDIWVAGGAGGVRYTTLGATTSFGLTSSFSNVRQLLIANGQLFASSGSGTNTFRGVETIGTGLPTSGTPVVTRLAGLNDTANPSSYGFVFADLSAGVAGFDTLYIADDAGAALSKFSLVGGSWTPSGTVGVDADDYRGLAATVTAGTVTLYATRKGGGGAPGGGELVRLVDSSGYNGSLSGTPTLIATAAGNTAFRGVALTPSNSAPLVSGLVADFSGVIGDPTDYASTVGLNFSASDDATPAASLIASAVSSNAVVVAAGGATVDNLGGGNFRLRIVPSTVGYSTITVSIGDGQGGVTSATLAYAASSGSVTPASTLWPLGTSDSSTAQALDADSLIVADDENQRLRVYSRNASGPALTSFDVGPALALTDIDGGTGLLREVDIEASTRSGNRIFWLGSHSNSKTGKLRPNRNRVFSTDISGSGAAITLTVIAHYDNLRSDLIAWDHGNAHGLGADYFGFVAGTAVNVPPEIADGSGFNIEGLSLVPGSAQRAYLAFRAPIVPTSARTRALIVPIENFADLGSGSASAPVIGTPIQLDLGGRGIREIQCAAFGCLIVAGPASDNGTFALYTWSAVVGEPALQRGADLSGLNPEGIAGLPAGGFADTSAIQLISDNGDTVYYADNIIAKDLPNANHRKFRIDTVVLGAAIDRTPDAFSFTAATSVQRNASVESGGIAVTGINASAVVHLAACSSACAFSINGAAYVSADSAVNNGDNMKVRQTAASNFSTASDLTLDIGGVSATFTVTTVGPPATIAVFSGTPQSAPVNAGFFAPLSARIRDNNGAVIAEVAVAFTAPASGPSAMFAAGGNSAMAITDPSGLATSPILSANALPGSYAVAASTVGVAAVEFALSNLGARAQLSTNSLKFASVRLTHDSAPQSINILNSGNVDLVFSSVAVSGDFQTPLSTCNGSLAASASCSVSVSFRPSALGPRSGLLGVTSNSVGSPDSVSLSGSGLPAAADLALSLSDGRTVVTPGQTLHYMLTLSNAGPDVATGVGLTDTFPPTLDGCQWTSTAAGGASGNHAGPQSGAIAENALSMPANSSITYNATCIVAASAPAGALINTASVGLPATVEDGNAANNSVGDTDLIVTDQIFFDGFDGQ